MGCSSRLMRSNRRWTRSTSTGRSRVRGTRLRSCCVTTPENPGSANEPPPGSSSNSLHLTNSPNATIIQAGHIDEICLRGPLDSQPATRHLVGRIPQAAGCLQARGVALRLEEALIGGGTAVLTGMGGVGKTQLAAAYARHVWENDEADMVVWVTASSQAGIMAAYATVAQRLALAIDSQGAEEAAERFLEWAQATSVPWLVILDDVQEPADVRELWLAPNGANRVLATTRLQAAALTWQGRQRVDVDLFTPDEARNYLVAALAAHSRTDATEQLDGLAKDLGFLPLALSQAAAYLIDADLDCAVFRERLADQQRQLEDVLPEEGSLPDDHCQLVATTWSLSIDRADQAPRTAGLARPLLHLVSVLEPNGIPAAVLTSESARDYLANCAPGSLSQVDAETVDEALRVLHRFSLIEHDRRAPHREVRVHQLVQRTTRETLTPDQRDQITLAVANGLWNKWPETEQGEFGAAMRTNADALHHSIGANLWTRTGDAYLILYRAADSLGLAGQVHAALAAFTRLHDISRHHFGPDHPAPVEARQRMAHWLGKTGDPGGAFAMFCDLWDDIQRLLGADHPRSLQIWTSLLSWGAMRATPQARPADSLNYCPRRREW
jgi:hypothetical protein